MWKDDYKKKIITIPEVASKVKSGDFVSFGFGPTNVSPEIHDAILSRGNELENVIVQDALQMRPSKFYDPEVMKKLDGHINHASGYYLNVARKIVGVNESDFMPVTTSDCASKAAYRSNVFMVMVTPPDRNGYCNFGICNFWNKEVVDAMNKKGGIVIAEVNDQMPILYGNNYVHVSQIDYFVENSTSLPEFKRDVTASDSEKAIGKYALELINDGDTIQMGFGGITETVVAGLDGKHDLGIFTEMMPPSVVSLVEKGIISNKRKPINTGKAISCMVIGDKEMYEYCRENPSIEMHTATYTNDPRIISQHPNMVAMNNAMIMDFNGQGVADSMGYRHVSGPGGQCDFAIGAYWSKGGKGVTMLNSTRKNKDGSLTSNIVPGLPEGTNVTLPRMYVDYVISEYGIAHLKYKTRRERALELISIAHPDFRGELKQTLKKVFYPTRYSE